MPSAPAENDDEWRGWSHQVQKIIFDISNASARDCPPEGPPPANMQRLSQEEKQRVRVKLAQAERKAYALLGSRKDSLVKISNDLVQCREMNAKALAQWFGDRPSCMATHSPAGCALQF